MWRDAHSLLRQRVDRAPELVGEAAALDIAALPFAPGAVRAFVTTGVGSSAAHAKLLAHLLAVELGLPARCAPAGAFVTLPRGTQRDVLVVFSTGLSPNARLALAEPRAWGGVVLVTAVAEGEASVPSPKFVAYFGEQSASLARRADDGISGIFRGGATPPAASRAGELGDELRGRDTSAGAERVAVLDAVQRAGGLCIRLPGGLEYGTLLRVAAPLAGYAIAYRLAAAIGHAAGLPVDRLALDADRIRTRMAAAAQAAGALCAHDDALAGRLAFFASGGYGDLADNLALKVQEGLFAPPPPVWDLIGFAHGPFQEVCEHEVTFLLLQRAGAPLEADLLARLHPMLDARRHRVLPLPSSLPGPQALFEHEMLLNELVLGAIAVRGLDQTRWPGRDRDRPLYEVGAAPSLPHSPQRAGGRRAAPARAARPPVTPPRRLETLTWPELEALLAAGHRTAVLPLGAIEQHGPHLPFATDRWIADALAERFCQRVAEAVRLPVLPIGCSSEHGDFPGTLSLHADTLRAVLRDVVASLGRHGFETVFIFSAHGGNCAALRDALPELGAAARPARVIAVTDLGRVAAVWHGASAAAGVEPSAAGHHAGEFETSIMLALRPDSVRRDQFAAGLVDVGPDPQAIFYPSLRPHSASGVVGDPRSAAAARAESYLAAWVDALIACYRREKKAKKTAGTQRA